MTGHWCEVLVRLGGALCLRNNRGLLMMTGTAADVGIDDEVL